MRHLRLDRRQLLSALGVGAAMVPFFPLLDAHGAATPPPKRLLFFFNSNGTLYDSWLPKMAGGKLELSPILAPLEKWKSKLLVVDGLAHKVVLEKSLRSGHTAGMNTVLTGRNNKITDPTQPLHSFATGISLDQHLAIKLASKTKLKTLECGVQVEPYNLDFGAISYSGPLQPILPESNPHRVFDRLFKGYTKPGASADPGAADALEDKRRVLALVTRDLEAMRGQLSRDDRVKMEAHIGAVQGIEHSLTTGAGTASGSTCKPPEIGAPLDPWKNDNIPAIAKLQIDLMVMALACDLTRIGTIQFGRAGAPHRFNWLGPEFATDPQVGPACMAKGFHALAHRESDPTSRAKLLKIHVWYAQQFAYLLEKLSAIPEAGATMLDHTAVVWLNELGTGADHSHERTPWVIAGNVGGYFKTGRLVSFPGQPHNRMLLTLAHAMGVPLETFGDADYCSAGELTGLTA